MKHSISFLSVILTFVLNASSTEFFVSPNGVDNTSNGTSSAPYKTIQYAIDKMKSGDVCKVSSGVYNEKVVFKTDNLTLQGNGGTAPVVISAADPVKGWSLHKGSIYKAKIKSFLPNGENQLFIKGTWYDEARWPNVDAYQDLKCPERINTRPNRCADIEGISPVFYNLTFNKPSVLAPAYITGWMDNMLEDKGFPVTPGVCRIGISGYGKELAGPEANSYNVLYGKPKDHWKGAVMFMLGWWWGASGIITESWDGTGTSMPLKGTLFNVATPRMRWPGSFIVIGHPDLIDKAGEWAIKDSMLYLWVPNGINPENGEIWLKQRYHAFDLQKRNGIKISGFTSIGGGVQMDSANSSAIDNCHFYCLSHTWLNYYDAVYNVKVEQEGKVGIRLSGNNNVFKNGSIQFSAGSAFVVYGKNNTVENNYIADINYMHSYSSPFLIQNGSENTVVTKNTIQRVGRSIFSGYNSCKVTYNKLFDAMMLSGDGGTMYTAVGGMREINSEIAYNWFKGCYGEPSTYLYSDWGCALGMKIHHNVFFDTEAEGKFVPTSACGMLYYNNTWLSKVHGRDWVFATLDSVYKDSVLAKKEWANNINAAYDQATWLFNDLANNDLTLKVNSPAINKGIVIPGVTDGYVGSAPDLGAYEYGAPKWEPGHTWGTPVFETSLWNKITGTPVVNKMISKYESLSFTLSQKGNLLKISGQFTNDVQLAVYNALGKRVAINFIQSNNTDRIIHTNGLSAGSYIIKFIYMGQDLGSKAFVIQ